MNGRRPGFWAAAPAGAALMGWGAALYLDATPDAARRFDFTLWVVGLDVVHDAVVAPIVVALGVGVSRLVRGSWRAPVQVGLIMSGAVLLVAALPLRGTAAGTRNPTIQPLDYTTATLTVLAAVWAAAAAWGGFRHLRV